MEAKRGWPCSRWLRRLFMGLSMLAPAVVPAVMPAEASGPAPGPAVMTLQVDATDPVHKVFQIRQRLPLGGDGTVTLRYPQWQAASHAPTGQVGRLAGLVVQANGQPVAWTRDPLDPHAFRLRAPAGTQALDVRFTYLSPRVGNLAMTRQIVNVGWSNLLLYPAGVDIRQLQVQAEVRLPAGMQFATSLEVDRREGDVVRFRPTSLQTLVDSPVIAGRHVRTVSVSEGPDLPVTLTLFATRPEDLALPEAAFAPLRASVAEVQRLFGARRRAPYRFLVVLDERMGGPGGIEHRHSTETFLPASVFARPEDNLRNLDLALHEYIHAWNGTQFLPAGMEQRHFNHPLQNSLLWVYEGLTQYLGKVAAARGGMRTLTQALDDLALDAAAAETRAARGWKPLRDSVHDPVILSGRGIEWPDFTGKKDYYGDGALLWLAVDVEIRSRSGGRLSLDDFVRVFFAERRGADALHPYTEADLLATLERLVPGDWPRFFAARLDTLADAGLVQALARGGYRLAYVDEPTETFRQDAQDRGVDDYLFSAGMAVGKAGLLRAVRWDGPAFRAGLTTGARLVAVNGQPYDAGTLRAAMAAGGPVALDAEIDGERVAVKLEAGGGLRYPRLVRSEPGPALIDAIFSRP